MMTVLGSVEAWMIHSSSLWIWAFSLSLLSRFVWKNEKQLWKISIILESRENSGLSVLKEEKFSLR